MSDLDQKLQQLRIEWKNNPEKRKIIELQVKVLKLAQQAPKDDAYELAKEIFS